MTKQEIIKQYIEQFKKENETTDLCIKTVNDLFNNKIILEEVKNKLLELLNTHKEVIKVYDEAVKAGIQDEHSKN